MLSLRSVGRWTATALFVLSAASPAAAGASHWYRAEQWCLPPVPWSPGNGAHANTMSGNAEYARQHILRGAGWAEKVYPVYGDKVRFDGGQWRWQSVARFYVMFDLAGADGWQESQRVAAGFNRTGRAEDGSVETGRFDWLVPFVFSAGNPEALVKFMDAGDSYDHFWLFVSAATDLPSVLRVWDATTGLVYVWRRGRGPAVALTSHDRIVKKRPRWCR